MRIARCTRPLFLHLLGNKSSVAISEGWEGDLDQVIGVDDTGKPSTIADGLGHHLTAANFTVASSEKKKPSSAPPQSQE